MEAEPRQSSSNMVVVIAVIVALAICVFCAGVAIVGWFVFGVSTVQTISLNGPFDANVTATAIEQQSFDVTGQVTFDLTNQFGDIEIRAGESGSNIVSVEMEKIGYGRNQTEAEAALNALKVSSQQEDNRIILRVETPVRGESGGAVNFTVTVPPETTTLVHSASGRISLRGTTGKADLSTDFGQLEVADFNGGLSARTRSGKIAVRRIGTLSSGEGDVSLISDFGEISLEDISTGPVKVSTRSGAVRLTNVRAQDEMQLETDFGELIYQTGAARTLAVKSRSGMVHLTDIELNGPVNVESEFGEIRLSGVRASAYNLTSGNGLIVLDGAAGSVEANSRSNDVRITNADEVTLNVETQTGSVTFRGSLGAGPHRIETTFGTVEVTLPAESAFEFDLNTQFGAIRNEFKTSSASVTEENHQSGEVNGGGPLLSITTQNGSIQLKPSN